MALFDELMARAGYVQLARYGLSLIPDGRIVQTEPRVLPLLDGGSGRRVVGWRAQECPLVAAAPLAAGAQVQVAGVVAARERSGRSSPRILPRSEHNIARPGRPREPPSKLSRSPGSRRVDG